jgi:hypothetical protein
VLIFGLLRFTINPTGLLDTGRYAQASVTQLKLRLVPRRFGSITAAKWRMRKFFLFALLLTAFFIWLNRNDNSKPATRSPDAQGHSSQSVSEHDWAKRSLDRARSVTEQARQNQVESQQP